MRDSSMSTENKKKVTYVKFQKSKQEFGKECKIDCHGLEVVKTEVRGELVSKYMYVIN